MAKILVVDDEANMRTLLGMILRKEGHQVIFGENGLKGWEVFQKENPDVVIQDIRMPQMGGIELLKKIKEVSPQTPVVVITAYSDWENAVEAMRLGAFDYIKKPFDNQNIRDVVSRAVSFFQMEKGKKENFPAIIGNSESLRKVLQTVELVAPTDATVLIYGESGTGKELIARALHLNSPRANAPFLVINCGALTESLLESELFGYKKGAFTGAIADKKGYLELAEGGTLVLDEVSEMEFSIQVKFLRALEQREFIPLGGNKAVKTNVRFIACTNRDLEEEVKKGRFREDLYYRLNVIPIYLPPLRERREDIPLLVGHFIAKYSKRMNKPVQTISKEALEKLCAYDWPGNVRELENVIQRAVALARGQEIEEVNLGSLRRELSFDLPPEGIDLERELEEIEKAYILKALERTEGNITKAAKLLGITFRSLRYKIQKFGIRPSE